MRILVIEDEKELASFIHKGLEEAGHSTDLAHDGATAMMMAMGEPYDVVILDRNLGSFDGLKILHALRSAEIDCGVLILSALAQVEDRVAGLRAGSDDYLVKPFAFSELLARVETLARRNHLAQSQSQASHLQLDDLEMDLLKRTVRRGDLVIDIKPREFRLLEFLLRHQGQVVTRTMILEKVWDYHFDPQTNIVDVHMSRLRRKIDLPDKRPLVHTVRGAGYVLRD
ncbi:MAG: response regulator transcription factor [Pseudomonadota bacterium]